MKNRDSLINQEIENLKFDAHDHKALSLPIIKEIIGFELDKEPENINKSRIFTCSCNAFMGVDIDVATFNYSSMAYEGHERYSIIRDESNYIIVIGKCRPDGIRIYTDENGMMTRATFSIEEEIALPTPNKKISDLKRFIAFQRELEEMETRAILSSFSAEDYTELELLQKNKKKLALTIKKATNKKEE